MAVDETQKQTKDLIKNLIAPKLVVFEQNDKRDLSSVTKPKQPPPWKVSSTKFNILSDSQQADLKKVNQQLEKIQKMLATTQTILNNTLGRLVTILKAIEDPLALLFQLLASEILKLEATLGSNMGIFMLDDVSERIKVKLTLGNTTIIDAGSGLNIAGGFNNQYGKALGLLPSSVSNNPLALTHLPTAQEAREMQKVSVRLEEFLRIFDEYNNDIIKIVEDTKAVYDNANKALSKLTVNAATGLQAGNIKNHYFIGDKQNTNAPSTQTNQASSTLKTFFDLPVLSTAISKVSSNGTVNYDRETYIGVIIHEYILSKMYVENDTTIDINTVDPGVANFGFILHPNPGATSAPTSAPDTNQINYADSVLWDTAYLKKVAAQADKVGTSREAPLQKSTFTDNQTRLATNENEKALFALVGSAVYQFIAIMADNSTTPLQKRIKTYEIIEAYFRKRLPGVDTSTPTTKTFINSAIVVKPEAKNAGVTSAYDATLIQNLITPNSGTNIDQIAGVDNETKLNYKNYFLIQPDVAEQYFKNKKLYRIETKYGLDADKAKLEELAGVLRETVGGAVESKERLILSNIFLRMQNLLRTTNLSDVHTPQLKVSDNSRTTNRNIIETSNTRSEKNDFSVSIPGNVRNQIKLIEESIATQIDSVNSVNDLSKYKKEYYNKTLDSFLLSLDNKFNKLQEVFDRLKLRGTDLATATKPVIANAQLLDTADPIGVDEFIILSGFIIEIINSIKATFQPFLSLKIAALDVKKDIAKSANDGTEIVETIKKLAQNEIDWNDDIIGEYSTGIISKTFVGLTVKQSVESYFEQLKQLLSGNLEETFFQSKFNVEEVLAAVFNEKIQGNLLLSDSGAFFDINRLNNGKTTYPDNLGNIFNLYQESFDTNETPDARKQRLLKEAPHLTRLVDDGSDAGSPSESLGNIKITKFQKKLLQKQVFCRYYRGLNIERLMSDHGIIEPRNFLKAAKIPQKIRDLKQLINDNIESNMTDALGAVERLSNWLASINDYLCSNDDSQTVTLPKEIQSSLSKKQKEITDQLNIATSTKKDKEKELNNKIKKINFTNNSVSGASDAISAKKLIEETNALINEVGGYKYYYDEQSKTIKIGVEAVTGTVTKQVNNLQTKLDAYAGQVNNAQLDLASSAKLESSISKMDTQISLTKQRIAELEVSSVPDKNDKADKLKKELESLEDLRKKTVQGGVSGASEVSFITKSLEKLGELNNAQREFQRITDDFDDVNSILTPENTIFGLPLLTDTYETGQQISVNQLKEITINEFTAFRKFLLDGDIVNFANAVTPQDPAITQMAKDKLSFIISDGKINTGAFATDLTTPQFVNTKLKTINKNDLPLGYSYAILQQQYKEYGTSYDNKIHTKKLFFSLEDTSGSSVVSAYLDYIDFTLRSLINTSTNAQSAEEVVKNNDILSLLSILKDKFQYYCDIIIDGSSITTGKFAVVNTTNNAIIAIFSKIDITTKLDYSSYKPYLEISKAEVLDSELLIDTESSLRIQAGQRGTSSDPLSLGDGYNSYQTTGYKEIKKQLNNTNPSFLLPLNLREKQLTEAKDKFDKDLKSLSQGVIPEDTTDNRGFFQLMLRSKNEWVEEIITAFTNEDDKRKPSFPDDMSSRNPLKVTSPTSNTNSPSTQSVQIVTDREIDDIKKILGDVTGGLTDALAKVNANSDMAVLIYLMTASDIVAFFNKVRPVYDTFISMRDGKPSPIKLKFDEYTTKIEKTFMEVTDSVSELVNDVRADAEFVSDAFKDKGILDSMKMIAKGFISFDCSETERISRALKASTKLPPEVANGITDKWASIRLTDIPPFQQLSRLSMGLAGLLKGLARPKIGLAKTIERILNNLNRKINLLKKIVQGINLMIEFLSFLGSFQIDAATLELENVRSVSFVEQCLRNSDNFPKPFGISTDDEKFFIASVVFVMPMPIYAIFKKFVKVSDRTAPIQFTPSTEPTLATSNSLLTTPGGTGTTDTTGNNGGVTIVV